MNVTPQQRKSLEKLRAVCPEITVTDSVRIDNQHVLMCGNFAPADDRKVYIHEDGQFIFWAMWESYPFYQIHQLRGES